MTPKTLEAIRNLDCPVSMHFEMHALILRVEKRIRIGRDRSPGVLCSEMAIQLDRLHSHLLEHAFLHAVGRIHRELRLKEAELHSSSEGVTNDS